MARVVITCQRYCSQMPGERKRISLPGGSRLSLMSETLQLPPVEYRFGEIAAGHRNVRGVFAVEEAQGEPRRRLADRDRRRNKATGTAMADIGFGVDHDRPVGHFGEGRQTFVRNVGRTGAVEGDTRVDDRRIIRQRGDALPYLGHRQTEKVDQFKLGGKGGEFFLVMAAHGLPLPGVTHNGDSLRGSAPGPVRRSPYCETAADRSFQSRRKGGSIEPRSPHRLRQKPRALQATAPTRAHHEFKR